MTSPSVPRERAIRAARLSVGGFFLMMSGVHLGIVAADPETYRHFADRGLVGFVRTGWAEVFMANPAAWGLVLMAGEMVLGVALLVGGRGALLGYAGVIAFHLGLLVFGWGIWLWSVPALAVLVPLANRERRYQRGAMPARAAQRAL